MTRILQALFLILFLPAPAICQVTAPSDTTREEREIQSPFRQMTGNTVWPDSLQTDTVPAVQTDAVPAVQTDAVPAAQTDTVPAAGRPPAYAGDLRWGDTLSVEVPEEEELDPDHSPSQAIMYALALPGLGQLYNQKYYKIPIVWGAMGGAGYAIIFNSGKYSEASTAYAQETSDINERILRYWRRNRELSYIALLAVYALQVVDAYVDAQLYYWNVNEDLSIRMVPSLQPMMLPAGTIHPSYGLTCSFKLGKP